AALLDHVSKIAAEHFARLRQRHRGVVAEFFLEPLSVAPLLRHPFEGHPRGHRLQGDYQAPCAASFAVDQTLLLAGLLNALERLSDCTIGKAWHWGLSSAREWGR